MSKSRRAEPTAHEQFHDRYITSGEICTRLSISRTALSLRRGFLPNAIDLERPRLTLWIRAEIEPLLAAWEIMLTERRKGKCGSKNKTETMTTRTARRKAA